MYDATLVTVVILLLLVTVIQSLGNAVTQVEPYIIYSVLKATGYTHKGGLVMKKLILLMVLLLIPTMVMADSVTVKVGVVGENNEQWEQLIIPLKEEGIEIELVKFSDYVVPNQALFDGEVGLTPSSTITS